VVAATGCASGPDPDAADPVAADLAAADLVESMAWRESQGDFACAPLHERVTSLGDLLPSTRFRGPDGTQFSLADAVVVGRFTDVEPGRGLVTPEPDGPSDLPTAFDDPDALYRTVHARFVVESVVAGEVGADTVPVGFRVDGAVPDGSGPTLDEVEQGLPALGRVIVFLDRSVFYDYDPAVLGVVEGLFLGRVGDDDRIELPLLPDDDAGRLLTGTPTLPDLEGAAARPVEVVDVGPCLERTG
jgi:hypothetical protein